MNEFRATFQFIKTRFDVRPRLDKLICKQGEYDGCVVLKLQKASWTNDPMDQVQNTSGVFFSVWIETKRPHKLRYNVHALKRREVEGYSITSRDFADEFRKNFTPMLHSWPNVRIDRGPLTLMEGWLPVDMKRLEGDVVLLMKRFERVSPLVDRLLQRRKDMAL